MKLKADKITFVNCNPECECYKISGPCFDFCLNFWAENNIYGTLSPTSKCPLHSEFVRFEIETEK